MRFAVALFEIGEIEIRLSLGESDEKCVDSEATPHANLELWWDFPRFSFALMHAATSKVQGWKLPQHRARGAVSIFRVHHKFNPLDLTPCSSVGSGVHPIIPRLSAIFGLLAPASSIKE
jgi:hypothetical protein